MSDGRVRAAIEQMEAWLGEPNWEPDPQVLVQWNAEFQAAMAQAEKGPSWPELMGRAHTAGHQLEARAALLAEARDRVKTELEALGRGNRALKGYGTSTR
jgi:flagellar hook-associated protein FlgK